MSAHAAPSLLGVPKQPLVPASCAHVEAELCKPRLYRAECRQTCVLGHPYRKVAGNEHSQCLLLSMGAQRHPET